MKKNVLTKTLPAEVGAALQAMGANLKLARTRRSLTAVEVAEEIGVSRWLVTGAERGKPTTSVAVYVALLGRFQMLERLADATDPRNDKAGMVGAYIQNAARVRKQQHGKQPEDDEAW